MHLSSPAGGTQSFWLSGTKAPVCRSFQNRFVSDVDKHRWHHKRCLETEYGVVKWDMAVHLQYVLTLDRTSLPWSMVSRKVQRSFAGPYRVQHLSFWYHLFNSCVISFSNSPSVQKLLRENRERATHTKLIPSSLDALAIVYWSSSLIYLYILNAFMRYISILHFNNFFYWSCPDYCTCYCSRLLFELILIELILKQLQS